MSSRTIDICDAIVTLINDAGRSWFGDVTAERKYRVRFNTKELTSGPKLAVVPREREREVQTKKGGPDAREVVIDLGFFEHVEGDEATQKTRLDELIELVESIEDFFLKYDFIVGGITVVCRATNTAPLFDPDMLDEKGVFGSVTSLELYEVA